jgi:hypothetical protein
MIQIENLTKYQVEMLDHMWSLDSYEEYQEWMDLLDDEDRTLAELLSEMVLLAEVDKIVGDCKEANNVLKKYTLGA